MNAPEDAAAQWAEAGRWLAKADEDIAVAELALDREPPLVDPAFHCQQAGAWRHACGLVRFRGSGQTATSIFSSTSIPQLSMFDYAGLKDYVASLFQGPVDVIDREALKSRLRPHAAAAISAFWH
jgi:hypothetical protein